MTKERSLRKTAIDLAKVAVSVALIGYLVWDSLRRGEGVFADEHGFNPQKLWQLLCHAEQRWYYLLMAFLCSAGSVLITFVRWWMLVRVLDVPLRLGESLRFSFIGYLLNLAPMGMVGGDLAKAVLAARRFPEHRPETVASVFVDRVLGLYTLFLVASGAIILMGTLSSSILVLRAAARAVLIATAVTTAVLILSWSPDISRGRLLGWLEQLPLIGRMLARFINAFRSYRLHPWMLIFSVVITFPVHLLFASSVFFISLSLFDSVHSLSQHFVFCPLAGVMQVIPISIGPAEFVLDRLYSLVPLADGTRVPAGQGLVALLVYRFMSLLLGSAGLIYFFSARKEWQDAIESAEDETAWQDNAVGSVAKL